MCGDYSYHNCGSVPEGIQVVEYTDGHWLLRDNYAQDERTGDIFYCPYCGKVLVGTETSK